MIGQPRPPITFVLNDDRTGPEILSDLDGIKNQVTAGDIFLFTYSGHTKTLASNPDPDADESEPGNTALTPEDEVMGGPTTASADANWIRDDQLADKLKEFPTDVTKVIVLNTCIAGGYAYTTGTRDLQTVSNIAVLMSAPEGISCDGNDPLESGLQVALTAGGADADGDGRVFAWEWYNVGRGSSTKTRFFANLDANHNVPIFSDPTPTPTPPTATPSPTPLGGGNAAKFKPSWGASGTTPWRSARRPQAPTQILPCPST